MDDVWYEVVKRSDYLIKTAKPIHLEVNQHKTMYLVISRETRADSDLIVKHSFQQMNSLKYLGANTKQYNNIHSEIKLRISAATKSYYALDKLFKSKFFSRQSKKRLYSSFLRPNFT